MKNDEGKNNYDRDGHNANVEEHDELMIMANSGKECLIVEYNSICVIDSETSFHATPSQDFFTTYGVEDLGVVKMKNNGTSKIVGQCDVHVVTSIGYKLMLKNARDILDLRVKLLSTGVLDDSRFTSYF